MIHCDLMVDLETMGTANDAAIVSIGAVFFDIATETTGLEFRADIHLATAVRDGGVMDPATVLWWLRQGDAARRHITGGTRDIRDALRDLSLFVSVNCPGAPGQRSPVRAWGNSPRFDLGILESAYRRASIPVFWEWFQERDFRTVRNLHSRVEYTPWEKGDGAHDAVTDCRFQIEHLFKIKRAVRKS